MGALSGEGIVTLTAIADADPFEDAVTSLEDVDYERVAYTVRLGFGEADCRIARFVLRNHGGTDHFVVPLPPQRWLEDRFSKRVRDETGAQVAFLGSELIREVMAEAAVRAFADSRAFLGETTQEVDEERRLRAAIVAPLKAQETEEWKQDAAGASSSLLRLAERVLRRREEIERRPDAGVESREHADWAERKLVLAVDLLEFAREGYYIPLVLLNAPLVSENTDGRSGGWRRYVEYETPLLDLDPVASSEEHSAESASRREIRERLQEFYWRGIPDFVKFDHEDPVAFVAADTTDSVHMRVVAPEGMIMREPEWGEGDRPEPGWSALGGRVYAFVRRKEHFVERQRRLGAGASYREILTYRFVARYREPGPIWLLSLFASVALVSVGFRLGAQVAAPEEIAAVFALVAGVWFGGHGHGVRGALTNRFGLSLIGAIFAAGAGFAQSAWGISLTGLVMSVVAAVGILVGAMLEE